MGINIGVCICICSHWFSPWYMHNAGGGVIHRDGSEDDKEYYKYICLQQNMPITCVDRKLTLTPPYMPMRGRDRNQWAHPKYAPGKCVMCQDSDK